mgnify:CR=1 FL=1
MDSSGQFARCEFCGMKYPKERLQAKVQEIKGTVKVDGPVSVQGIETKEELLRNAETCLNLQKYDRAEEIFKRVIEKYPEEPQGWWGVFKTGMYSVNYNDPNWEDLIKKNNEYAQTALRLKDYSAEYADIWQMFINNYGWKLHIDEKSESYYEEISYGDRKLIELPSLIDNKYIKCLKQKIVQNYIDEFQDGQVTFFPWSGDGWGYPCYNVSEDMMKLVKIGEENAKSINSENEYCDLSYLKNDIMFKDKISYIGHENDHWPRLDENVPKIHDAGSFDWEKLFHIKFVLGKTLIVETPGSFYDGGFYTTEFLLLCDYPLDVVHLQSKICKYSLSLKDVCDNYKERKRVQQWIDTGKCSACGGTLKTGLFGTKCVKCGKKKDY